MAENRKKPGSIWDVPLEDDDLPELAEAVGRGYERLRMTPGQQSNEAVVEAINDFVQGLVDNGRRDCDTEDSAIDLGCLWAHMVCGELGWEWRSVVLGPDEEICAIVAPDRSCFVPPYNYFHSLITQDPEIADVTVLLVFNILKDPENRFPAGEYRCIM